MPDEVRETQAGVAAETVETKIKKNRSRNQLQK